MEQHVMEGVTYEIVDVVDASSYARLNPEDETGADVQYLELGMEVVEAVSDAAEYFSNAEDSQDEGREEDYDVKGQVKLVKANGDIKQGRNDRHLVNKRKRTTSDASLGTSKGEDVGRTCEGDSLDLFFQSMAQTVLHLPPQVQAKIKLEICKVISRAEIKYCDQGRT